MMWPLWYGKLWIIDDYGIVALHATMTEGNQGFVSSMRSALAETEVGHWGQSGRYRPTYFFFYALKTWLFGTDARAWFMCNAAIFFLSVVMIGLSIRRFFPWPIVLTGMLLFSALPSYIDIWGRLGPAEIYGCLWTALFTYAVARHIAQKDRLSWPLMCFAAFMATGAKENFALLLLPLAAVLVYDLRRDGFSVSKIISFLFPLGIACAVYGSVAVFMAGMPRAADIYGHSVSLLARARVAVDFVYAGQRAALVAMSFLLFFACIYAMGNKARDALNSFVAMVIVSVCVFGNFIFHNGETFLVLRYGFMEQMFIVALFFIALFPVRDSLNGAWADARYRRRFLGWCGMVSLASLIVVVGLSRINYFRVQRTLEFDEFLKRAREYDSLQIINLGQPLSSAEQYYSLRTFAKAGLAPRIYYFPAWAKPENDFQKSLRDDLMAKAEADPAPPLTPRTALAEFSPNGWFRFIEHTSPHRDVEQTVLIDGWAEPRSYLDKFLGRYPSGNGRRSTGNFVSLALPVDGNGAKAYRITLDASPFNKDDDKSDIAFFCGGSEVAKVKLRDLAAGGVSFDVGAAENGLLTLEARIENGAPERPNGLVLRGVEVEPIR
ncbi:MAG: hypothetical protein LBR38_00975 [Synergistaceae bacterium]|jgi:hypothetical protein|nr:hypothetical protein [Synergistaceae bacterium]